MSVNLIRLQSALGVVFRTPTSADSEALQGVSAERWVVGDGPTGLWVVELDSGGAVTRVVHVDPDAGELSLVPEWVEG